MRYCCYFILEEKRLTQVENYRYLLAFCCIAAECVQFFFCTLIHSLAGSCYAKPQNTRYFRGAIKPPVDCISYCRHISKYTKVGILTRNRRHDVYFKSTHCCLVISSRCSSPIVHYTIVPGATID